jgi:hypothetical protein
MVSMVVVSAGLVSFGMAAAPQAAKSPEGPTAESPAKVPTNAELRAEYHRTLAALIEARSVEKPDQAKVDELTHKLQELRTKLGVQGPVAGANARDGWMCPWGGPGMGFGRGAGMGPGFGRGRGMGGGRGLGLGPGAGQGLAPGGAAFVDQDRDGVCDYYELRHGLHR